MQSCRVLKSQCVRMLSLALGYLRRPGRPVSAVRVINSRRPIDCWIRGTLRALEKHRLATIWRLARK